MGSHDSDWVIADAVRCDIVVMKAATTMIRAMRQRDRFTNRYIGVLLERSYPACRREIRVRNPKVPLETIREHEIFTFSVLSVFVDCTTFRGGY